MPDNYHIDGKEVSEREFKRFQATLRGEENWSCSETNTGGIVDFESVGPDGRRYRVSHTSEPGRSAHAIEFLPAPE